MRIVLFGATGMVGRRIAAEATQRGHRVMAVGDQLLADADGVSRISAEDYAVAFVDEPEQGAHPRARISVAY
ncbi:hypothetical protein [Streptomyces sp. NPDC093261]|uniref:hypothetical protein n=1 Tax=Streptomyces sp. NPDC093261 TaxID=3366037 RepID=UPI0038046280